MTNLDKVELAKIGVQFGGLTRWSDPRIKPYVYERRNKIYILDLAQIIEKCQKLRNYLRELVERRGRILFLATKKQAREIVKEQAIKCNMPYIVNKWKGGFLTNWREIGRKLEELQKLNNFLANDNFKNKKERTKLEKRRNKLQSIYEGVVNLHKKPDTLFIIGLNKEKTALKETKIAKIPVIAVCNTNCNPNLVDYVIPGNDESMKSINFFASLIAAIINEIKKEKMEEISKETKENEEIVKE